MNERVARAELVQSYESLRAQATGQVPTTMPRGLALLLSSGLSAWMAACAPVSAPVSSVAGPGEQARALAGRSVELVRVLTEMALGGLRRCEA